MNASFAPQRVAALARSLADQLSRLSLLLMAQGCKTVQKDDGVWFALDNGILIKAN